MMRAAVLVVLSAVFGSSCQGDGDDGQPAEEVCEPSRTMSEACCPELGIDACGAGLVCAALDGRTQPTCYSEYSRLDGSECSEDKLCFSRECSDGGRCLGSPGALCEPELGCAKDPMGGVRECVPAFAGSSLCLRVDQPAGSVCTFDAECLDYDCGCGGAAGRVCCSP